MKVEVGYQLRTIEDPPVLAIVTKVDERGAEVLFVGMNVISSCHFYSHKRLEEMFEIEKKGK